MNLPWNAATAAACGIDWLLKEIAPAGGLGRAARKRERAFAPGDEDAARAALERAARVAGGAGAERLAALRAALGAVPDPRPALVRAQGGDVLGDVDFFELGRFLDGVAEIEALASDGAFAGVDVPRADAALSAALAPGRTRGRSFYLDDAFDEALARARGESAARDAAFDAARSRVVARVRAAGVDAVRDGEFVLMRDAMPTPLPAEIRVLREAPTYVMCELALDEPARASLAARDAAAAVVAEEEERVRERLSAAVREAAPALERACDVLGELDALAARAAFAVRHACVAPAIANDASVDLRDARFPPLAEALATRGRPYVPISLALDGMAVVTGPNMGGKTAALRTLGFAAACVALGVPVPARAATLSLFDDVAWLGIGGEGEAAGDEAGLLSSFGAEIVALRAFLERPASRALVLVDEFARTTSPREGRALTLALVHALRARGAVGLAATHYDGVAEDAGVAHYAIGRLRETPSSTGDAPLELDAALERIARAMDYALERVDGCTPAGSDAIALARALGLDAALIARAEAELRGTAT